MSELDQIPQESADFSSHLSPDDGEPAELDSLAGFTYQKKKGETVSLTPEMESWIVKRITTSFDRYEQAKKSKEKRWQKTKKAVQGIISEINSDRFNGLVPFGKQSLQTLISHFWSRSLQTPAILFNVKGNDDQAQTNAPLQKENLLRLFKKDRLQQKLDDGVYEALMKGVVLAYVGYEQRKQEYAVPMQHASLLPQDQMQNADNGLGMSEFEQMDYDAGTLNILDPYDFVFDTDNHKNWDKCFKGLRTYQVFEDIADNPNYSNFEELEDLAVNKEIASTNTNPFSKKDKNKLNIGVDASGRLELIEFHGDIRLQDRSYLRNWTITIAARKKVIRFERNPAYINPFIKWTYEKTDDGWGISPLDYIIPLIDASSMLLNSGVEGAKIAINPPWLAPKGMMPQKKFYLEEGMAIEYSPNMALPNVMPEPIQLKIDAPFPYVQLMETQSEATTGATRQLSGNVTSNDNSQTATEFNGLQVVGNLILDRLVDLFNMDFKIPVIEKIAKITSMFNPEEVSLPIENDQGVTEFQQIKPEVYYGNYTYEITDNKSEQERKGNLQQEIQFASMLSQDPDVSPRLKKIDAAKEIFKDMGYGSPAKLFMSDQEFIAKKLSDTAIAQFIGELSMQMPLGQMMMANGGNIDPNMLAQMSMQAAMQAQGVVNNAVHPANQAAGPGGQAPSTGQNGAPPGTENNPAMAGGSGIPVIPGVPPVAD